MLETVRTAWLNKLVVSFSALCKSQAMDKKARAHNDQLAITQEQQEFWINQWFLTFLKGDLADIVGFELTRSDIVWLQTRCLQEGLNIFENITDADVEHWIITHLKQYM